MVSIESIVLEVPDPSAADAFYTGALDLGDRVRVRGSEAPTSGFRGFTLSLVVAQPSAVDHLVASALDAGATEVKPVRKSLWGYGGVVQAPDGTICTLAASSKKDTGSAERKVDDVVLQLGVEDVKASKQFYVDHGLTVAKSFGRKYVEFDMTGAPATLTLLGRTALAKTAGVSPEGTGSHRITIRSEAGPFTDPDGFTWESV
ncbi:glyoxalase [Rhodococcus artemisiae]|uniref:Glyoxalase n=1 Tax=Rhodococcus artemisiae TaxID=714159 RepID=A0ABU7L6C2_9NOCA|nr:glyoxalase [Rhodococcus artemisiae]MEE2057091.1 glyoxalase [Rhodococcus artemisiae]